MLSHNIRRSALALGASRQTAPQPAALSTAARLMSRLSHSAFSSLSATPSPSAAPQAVCSQRSGWTQKWAEMQSLVAMTPNCFSTALQARYTRSAAPGEETSKTASTLISLADVMAIIRRLFYTHQLHRRLGVSPLSEDDPACVGDSEKLTALFRTLRQRPTPGASNTIDHAEGILRTKGDGNKGKGGNAEEKGKEDGAGEDGEDKPEDWIVPRTCLFVLIMIAITVVLYQLAQPRGVHTGWASLNKHASSIRKAVLYENYLQVYMDDTKVHLGLVSDQDTQRRIDELSDKYRSARQQAIQIHQEQQSQKTTTTDEEEEDPTSTLSTATDKPAELEVVMKGRPLAETALIGVGVFAWVVPFIFFPVFVMFLSQYIGKSMSYAVEATKGKTKAKEMIFRVETASNTRFRDIAGMKEPKKEITEIVDFLRHPDRYTKLGAKIPTGAILLGPPGTGKTLLAKAVAGESGVGFIPAIGSDFVELYVGMGALRVRQLFKEARKQRCIIYIDEIDAIGLKRQGAGHGEKQEQEQTLNELLTQLDGFSTGRRGDVMVLASSNVAQEALDPALIRPGRFDRIIHVDTPVISERVDIFKVHLSKLKLTSDDKEVSNVSATATASAVDETTTGGVSTPPVVVPSAAPASTETSLVLSQVQTETEHQASGESQRKDSTGNITSTEGKHILSDALNDINVNHDFDFHSLLMQKSDRERAMIDAYAQRMSSLCPGFVGADIANVCNEGAILAAREGADHVTISHLERSIDRVLAGIEHRSRALSDFEKNVVAHHEAGHAVAGWFLNCADPLMKVSIVPRGGSALGYAQYLPNENFTRTAKEIRDSISVTLGGRVAEQIFFNHLSTGASDDLRKVGRMAYQYVSSFAPGSVYPPPGSSSTRLMKPFGVDKSNDLDRRAKVLVDEIYVDTLALLTKHKDDMKKLANHLLQHELLTYTDVVHYLGERATRQTDKKKGV